MTGPRIWRPGAATRAIVAAGLIATLTGVGVAPANAVEKAPVRRNESPAASGGRKDPAKGEAGKGEAGKGEAGKSEAGKGAAETPVPPAPPPLYEAPMLRLAETLGALAFLRDLCGPGDGAQWRERMQALVDAEDADERLRGRLAGAFNRGFQDYAMVYRFCTPAARTLLTRRLAEGERLSRDLAARWGR
jgi:uncharacterized protein (TIGR02301 family)